MSAIPEKDEFNYYHPTSEQEIINLVNYARENKYQVRVRGSGHSMPKAIFTNECNKDHIDVRASAPDGNNVNIKLDKYTSILSRNGNHVTVQAGIHLGHDPYDPLSTLENSLLYQLHHTYELAINDLGGTTHQTVAGFLSTGLSGSSINMLSMIMCILSVLLMVKAAFWKLAEMTQIRTTFMLLSSPLVCLESHF